MSRSVRDPVQEPLSEHATLGPRCSEHTTRSAPRPPIRHPAEAPTSSPGGSRASASPEPTPTKGGRGPRFRFPRWLLWLTLGLLLLNVLVARQVPDERRARSASRSRSSRTRSAPATSPRSTRRATSSRASSRSELKPPRRRRRTSTPKKKFETTLPDVRRQRAALRATSRRRTSRSTPSRSTPAARCSPTSSCSSARRSCSSACSSSSCAAPAAAPAARSTGLGRSKAKRYEADQQRTTFEDVAGIDEAEEELVEIVDFLKNPDKYRKLGAMIPKGVLLSRPARHRQDAARPRGRRRGRRAVLLAVSASEFIEMVVGVGASPRARPVRAGQEGRPGDHLHRRARRDRPLARRPGRRPRRPRRARADAQPDPHRDGRLHRLGGRHRPRRDEPPGDPRPGAAAPRPLRPPRRRQRRPTRTAASKILEVHSRGKPLADEVDLARRSPPRPRAWSAPTCATSSTRPRCRPRAAATTRSHLGDFTNSLERIILGAERRITISARRARAHRLPRVRPRACSACSSPAPTRCARSRSSPAAARSASRSSRPRADRYGYDQRYLKGRIVGALGGRAAEEIVYGNVTTGAESDLEQVTNIARQMVGRWGMSDAIGLVSRPPRPERRADVLPRHERRPVGGHARAGRPRGPADRRRVLRGGAREAAREPRPARVAGHGRCSSTRRSTRTTPTAPPGFDRKPPALDEGGTPDARQRRAPRPTSRRPTSTRWPPRSVPVTRATSAIEVRPCLTFSRPSSRRRRHALRYGDLADLVGRGALDGERADLVGDAS